MHCWIYREDSLGFCENPDTTNLSKVDNILTKGGIMNANIFVTLSYDLADTFELNTRSEFSTQLWAKWQISLPLMKWQKFHVILLVLNCTECPAGIWEKQ